jgi:hypothetical protein
MAKQPKKTNKQIEKQQASVDNYARILQIVAIIAVAAIVIVQQFVESKNQIPIWIPAGLMGVAIGLSPEQFVELIKAFFTGRKSNGKG